MDFYLDTADLEEIRKVADLGLIDGVTTNPSLIAKSGAKHEDVILAICKLIPGPVSAEVIATEFDNMVEEAKKLAAIHENVVVKVPLTRDGLKTVTHLAPRGVSFNVTLCFSVGQALLAAKAGADYISPFVGRLDDLNARGLDLAAQIVEVYRIHGFETRVLVASVRSPLHVTEAALIGADIATMPVKVFEQLYRHPLTDTGLKQFLADYHASLKTE